MQFYFGESLPSASELTRLFITFKLYQPSNISLVMEGQGGSKPSLSLTKADGRPFAFFGPIQTLEEVYNRITQ